MTSSIGILFMLFSQSWYGKQTPLTGNEAILFLYLSNRSRGQSFLHLHCKERGQPPFCGSALYLNVSHSHHAKDYNAQHIHVGNNILFSVRNVQYSISLIYALLIPLVWSFSKKKTPQELLRDSWSIKRCALTLYYLLPPLPLWAYRA